MTLGMVGVAMGLLWLLATWALGRSFDEVGRAIILDDLGEYRMLYQGSGPAGVSSLFAAGEHGRDQLLRITSPSGGVVLDVDIPGQPWVKWPTLPPLPPMEAKAIGAEEIHWHRQASPDGATLTIGRQRLPGGGEIWFGRTNASDLLAIERVHDVILVAMGITALLSIGPVFWFASRVLGPVRRLIEGARRLAREENLDHRLEVSQSIPELGEFASSFNETLGRIQVLTEELEAANDQLAHELRTPLARIRGNVGRILARADSPASREDAARSLEEIDRASLLINSILSIRAGDSRTMKLHLEQTPLSELVRETCELYSAAAEEKDLDFELLITGEGHPMMLDRQRIQQALCNLLDNALAYTPPGGRVEVEVDYLDHSVLIQVRDTGPGLTEGDFSRIWRRFTRGSASSANTPGIGLGLSLVRAVVSAHRGEAGARNREGGGAEFWIKLPESQDHRSP